MSLTIIARSRLFHPHIIFIYCYYIFYCRIFCVRRKIFLREFHIRVSVASWDHDWHEYSSSLCRLCLTMDETRSPFNNIGPLNVHELFWMLQCNLIKSDKSTFFVLNVNWVFVRDWVLPYINEKVTYISTHQRHQTLIRRKTLRFPRSFLSQDVTHRIRVVTKYQDFYHCGRWLHHHNSRGFHVRFYSVKQCLTPTTYFFMF